MDRLNHQSTFIDISLTFDTPFYDHTNTEIMPTNIVTVLDMKSVDPDEKSFGS